MKLAGVDTASIAPGDLVRWDLVPTSAADPVSVAPSENEKFHLDATRSDGAAGWLALTIELDGQVRVEDLTRAIRSMLDRHEVLRCHFDDAEAGPVRRCLPTGAFTFRPGPASGLARPTEHVVTAIARTCSPRASLRHYVAAVRRETSTTVILGFDHCYVDAYSLAVIAADFVDDLCHVDVRPPVSYLRVRTDEEASLPGVDSDDARVRAWGEFLEANDWRVPAFPLDLGLGPGEVAPVHTDLRTLMSAVDADRHDRAVRDRGARVYPSLLTAVAQAVRDVGGPSELATILPVHTRHTPGVRRTVGWLVANVPIRLLAHDDCSDGELQVNTTRLAAALPLAGIGLTPVYTAYADLIRRSHRDVFMVSYLDYRRTDLPRDVATQQISADRESDTAQFWFWRDQDGIHLRTRHPRTVTAARALDDVLGAVSHRLHELTAPGQRVG